MIPYSDIVLASIENSLASSSWAPQSVLDIVSFLSLI